MNRDDVLQILAEHAGEIQEYGVTELRLFGSVARDEARSESDVDILIEVKRPFGYFQLVDLQEYLERILNRPVDLFTPGSVRDEIRDNVLRDAIRAA